MSTQEKHIRYLHKHIVDLANAGRTGADRERDALFAKIEEEKREFREAKDLLSTLGEIADIAYYHVLAYYNGYMDGAQCRSAVTVLAAEIGLTYHQALIAAVTKYTIRFIDNDCVSNKPQENEAIRKELGL